MNAFPTSKMTDSFGLSLSRSARSMIEGSVPHLRGDFAVFGAHTSKVGFDDDLAIVTMEFRDAGIPAFGVLEPEDFASLKQTIGQGRSFDQLSSNASLKDRFGWNKFVLALDVTNGAIDYDLALDFVEDWINGAPIERALKHNVDRVKDAIPTPPQYALDVVQSAMWVLECDETIRQGSAFELAGYGVITNEHVINGAKAMMAFRPNAVSKKYPVKVLAKNAVLDLAILGIDGAPTDNPLEPSSTESETMDHVAVCGFPNYRLGDTGVLIPGLVVGTRQKSGVRRLMTNASIVSGMSGGPALGADGKVIGICVSGADSFADAADTEDHAIIPVSALELLER